MGWQDAEIRALQRRREHRISGLRSQVLPNGVFQRPVSCLVSCESVYREEGEISVAKCLRFTFRGEGVAAVGSALVIWSLGDTLQENAETHLLE